MLAQTRHLLGILAALLFTALLTLTPDTPAHAYTNADGGGDTGGIGITNPGSGGGGGDDLANIDDITFTPGPTTCTLNANTTGNTTHKTQTIGCTNTNDSWSATARRSLTAPSDDVVRE